jgi:hypothetical protein
MLTRNPDSQKQTAMMTAVLSVPKITTLIDQTQDSEFTADYMSVH